MTHRHPLRALLPLVIACAGCPEPGSADAGGPQGARVAVVKDGDGAGVITSEPDGVVCALDCDEAEAFFPGGADGTFEGAPAQLVTLQFAPGRDDLFFGWACTSTIAGQEVTYASSAPNVDVPVATDADDAPATSCTVLVRRVHLLQVIKSGTGDGDVRGSLVGQGESDDAVRLDCGDDCTGAYFKDDVEVLTATPAAGSAFVQWALDCAGTTASVEVVMDDQKLCEAVFDAAP